MSVQLECIGCREIKQFSGSVEFPVCLKCEEWEIQHHKELEEECAKELKKPKPIKSKEYLVCRMCGYEGPAIDHHHIYGRKVSDETIIVCANCHRELHAGARILQ